jgi:hypothetical protein
MEDQQQANPVPQIIAAAITHRLRNPPKRTLERPSIAELEKMLNQAEPQNVDILPSGEVTTEMPVYANDLACVVIDALREAGYGIYPIFDKK